MNPEFRRNLWLELTPRRMATAAILLALAFFAAALSGGSAWRPASVASFIYYVIVVLWGSRNAALSVVGEIRDRTWDAQRLSSLSAAEMTWGKLFGSTIYNWYAGGICLVLMLAQQVVQAGIVTALIDLVYFLEIGVIAQAAALLASLIAVRRRQPHCRAEIFLYQLAGILAAIAVFCVWATADPGRLAADRQGAGALHRLVGPWLRCAPLPAGVAGAVHGLDSHRLLSRDAPRTEDGERPAMSGSASWSSSASMPPVSTAGCLSSPDTAGWDAVALRLGLAASTFATLTYIMVLLEPKDRVHFRWLGTQLAAGRLGRVLWGLQGFMMSYAALVLRHRRADLVALGAWRRRWARPP